MKAAKIISIVLTAFILNFASPTKAATVEFNLIDLGCPTVFDHNSSNWSIPLNLEETFSNISHVYIDLSGEITAGLGLYYYPDPRFPPVYEPPPPPDDPNIPYPKGGAFSIQFVSMNTIYSFHLSGGESTYPDPEPFDMLSEIEGYDEFGFWPPSPLNVSYTETIMFTQFIEHGSMSFNSAALIVEGTLIPEPATLFLLCLGTLFLKKHKK